MRYQGKNGATGASLAIVLAASISHAALALPSGGSIVSGHASISPASGGTITVNQTTNKAIIDWSKFSIDANQSVIFYNGSGATLNRVTGADASLIYGNLGATGSVYLINPNGVIIGRNGAVNVGGTFVASTLDVADSDFKNGGSLTFSGSSDAAVINLGAVAAFGGDIVLTATTVRNTGSLWAPNGDLGVLAGSSVLIRDVAKDDGKFAVEVGASGSSVTNRGALQAAMVELRANQGNVYALAGNTTGVINATGVSTKDGKVFLVATGGDTIAHGVITATKADGSGGEVKTAGDHLTLTNVSVSADDWTLNQGAFVLTQSRDTVMEADLATTNITVATTGVNGGSLGGDISVRDPLNWSSANSLTLSARHNVVFLDGSALTNDGGAAITLAADNEARGRGTVQFGAGSSVSTAGPVTIFYNPVGNDKTSVNSFSYTAPTDFSANVSAGSLASYMLVNTIYDLQNIENNLSGTYDLGRNIDASATVNWNGGAGFSPIGNLSGIGTAFSGRLDGNDRTISNLFINSDLLYIGLFGVLEGSVSNLNLNNFDIQGANYFAGLLAGFATGGSVSDVNVSGKITGASTIGGLIGSNATPLNNVTATVDINAIGYSMAGGLLGSNEAPVIYAFSSGSIAGYGALGGLVGFNSGFIQSSESTDTIRVLSTRQTNIYTGGLVGENDGGKISDSFATGELFASYSFYTGGLVGADQSQGQITRSYATGTIHANGSVGGLVGYVDGPVSNSYWDEGTTSQKSAVGFNTWSGNLINVAVMGGASGISPTSQSTYVGFDFSPSGPWTIVEGVSYPTLKAVMRNPICGSACQAAF